tara:strand:+ start:879 stop:1019 length:141 start_codon:yes stop_codon:yes gene_type:complete
VGATGLPVAKLALRQEVFWKLQAVGLDPSRQLWNYLLTFGADQEST